MWLFPAHAGVIPSQPPCHIEQTAFPRTRGGDPNLFLLLMVRSFFSPHTRG